MGDQADGLVVLQLLTLIAAHLLGNQLVKLVEIWARHLGNQPEIL